ncbi:MAG: thiol-disulfide oxidoreductase DCC family protein [SAR202 cluster bacterium]|nr:thiol-disulfide oxidoreductase DCC family protein [SAR202 cluster bacterium]
MEVEPSIVLFDGVCNLCNSSVQFIIDRDPKRRFVFASLQSEVGKAVLAGAGIDDEWAGESVVLVTGGRAHRESGAALRIARRLRAPWPALYALIAVPPFLRNAVYRLVARNRYRWFGRRDVCRVPGPGDEERFLG